MPLSPEESALARALVARALVKREAIERCADALDRLRSRGQKAELRALLVAWKLVAPADIESVRRAVVLGETAGGPAVPTRGGIPGAPATVGPYVLRGVLGSGGMATVYEAEDPALGRPVALKVLQIASGNTRAVERMRREAKALASFRHPHIVAVHATGETRDLFWIALERVDGRSLAQRLGEEPRLSPRDVAALLGKVARALQAAHAVRILHRDVKPANIIVDEAGEPRLVDFGIALDLADDSKRITRDDMIVGTPAYLAPEQLDGAEATEHTDIWSLGVTLHEVLSGELPFHGDTTQELFGQIMRSDPRPIPRAPTDLQVIGRKTLEKEARDRYASAAALASDLEAFARGEPIEARSPSFVARLIRGARRRRGALALVVLLVALGGGAAVWARGLRARSDEEALHAAARPYEEAIAAGRAAEKAGELPRALESYDRALLARAGDPAALAGKGRVEEALGDFYGAERILRAAVASIATSLPPAETAATLGALGRAMLDHRTIVPEIGDMGALLEDARALVTRGLALSKDDPLLLATLARVEASARHRAEVRALLARIPPGGEAAAEAAHARGLVACGDQDYAGMTACAREAMKGSPHERLLSGWAFECAGDDVAGLETLQALLREQPENASFHGVLAHIHANELRFEEAARESAAASGRGASDPNLEARIAKASGRDQAVDSVRAAVDRASYLLEHGDGARDAEHALELARSAQRAPNESKADVSDADILLVTGRALRATGDYPLALKCLDFAVERAGWVRSLRRERIEVLLQLKRDQDALAEADTILAGAPADPPAMKGRLRALVQLGRIDEALASVDAFARLRPADDAAATELVVYVFMEAGQYARAVAAASRTRERPASLATFWALSQRLALDPPAAPRPELPPSEDWGDGGAGSWGFTPGEGVTTHAAAALERDARRRIYGQSSARLTSYKEGDAAIALFAPEGRAFDVSSALVFWVHVEAREMAAPYERPLALTVTFRDAQDREAPFSASSVPVAGAGWHRVRVDGKGGWKRGGAADADLAHATEIDFSFEGIAPGGAIIWIDGVGPE